MRLSRAILVLSLALFAGGCIAAANAPQVAPASAGDGAFALRILVTDEPHGAPVPGAQVSVLVPASDVWDGPREQVVDVVTGPDGVAIAHVDGPAEAIVRATAAGYTRETLDGVGIASTGAKDVTVPLYHERAVIVVEDKLGPAGASTHRLLGGSFNWQPHELAFGANDDARRGYAARLVSLNVTLDWTNGPLATGDLGIALGKTRDRADVVQDNGGLQLAPGTYKESLAMTPSDFRRAGWRDATTLFVGAGTGSAYAAPEGLPYKLTVNALFDGDQARHESPGPNGLWGALGGLSIAALLLGRKAS